MLSLKVIQNNKTNRRFGKQKQAALEQRLLLLESKNNNYDQTIFILSIIY